MASHERVHSLDLRMPGELDAIEEVIARFEAFCALHAVPDHARRAMDIAFDDLLHNVVVYAYRGAAGRFIDVAVRVSPEALEATLSDDGPRFDPFAVAPPDTTLDVEHRQMGGLGVHLVRHLMDEVGHQWREGRNVVTLRKSLRVVSEDTSPGPDMDITTQHEDGAFVLALAGHLDTKTAKQAEEALDAAVAGGHGRLVVDFARLEYISSVGLRVLLATLKKLKKVGGQLHLAAMNPTVKEVFVISGFNTIFSIFDTRAEALAAF